MSNDDFNEGTLRAAGYAGFGTAEHRQVRSSERNCEPSGHLQKYLEIIIKVLVQNQLLAGLRGKGGGYRLTKEPGEYTLGEILRLTEGSLAPVACVEESYAECSRLECCLTRPVWQKLDTIINEYLDGITLEDLIKSPQKLV